MALNSTFHAKNVVEIFPGHGVGRKDTELIIYVLMCVSSRREYSSPLVRMSIGCFVISRDFRFTRKSHFREIVVLPNVFVDSLRTLNHFRVKGSQLKLSLSFRKFWSFLGQTGNSNARLMHVKDKRNKSYLNCEDVVEAPSWSWNISGKLPWSHRSLNCRRVCGTSKIIKLHFANGKIKLSCWFTS